MPPPLRRSVRQVPPLGPGDRLTRHEFERRYDAMHDLKKAELLEGVVFVPTPAVRWDFHATPHADIIAWLVFYEKGLETPEHAAFVTLLRRRRT